MLAPVMSNGRQFLRFLPSHARGWPLQIVVGVVFTCLLLAIAGGLVLYNHIQLTEFAQRQAQSNFDTITRAIRSERLADNRAAELILDMTTSLIDPNMPAEQLRKTLLGLMRNVVHALPSTFAIQIAYPDGGMIGVQDMTSKRPSEIIGLGGNKAVLGLDIVEHTGTGAHRTWLLYDRSGREVARAGPFATEFDVRQRDWYRQAVRTTTTIVSPPYAFSNASGTGLTSARIMKNGSEIVFGIDETLASLDQTLANFGQQIGTEIVVFDGEGRLIAYPERQKLIRHAVGEQSENLPFLSELGNPVLSEIARIFSAKGFVGESRFKIDGQEYIVRFEPVGIEAGDYILGIAIPEALLMGEAYRIRLVLLAAAAIALFVGLILVFLTARRVVSPLKLATRGLDEIMQLHFGQVRPIRSRIVEVADLGRAVTTIETVLRNFARYVPFQLVRGIIDNTFSTELGGRRQPICILFSDIEGFTGLAESLDPDTLTRQTSRYFAEIGEEIVRSKGTIDKYIGDAVMAFWNAPEFQEDFVRLACLGALRASRRIDRLNAEFRRENAAEMPTRFALHVGEAVVGNVGSADRINYTALGHAVNLASRLEGLNRDFGTTIMVSEAVVQQAGSDFTFRLIGKTVPRGASQPIQLYELAGAWTEDEPELAPQGLKRDSNQKRCPGQEKANDHEARTQPGIDL